MLSAFSGETTVANDCRTSVLGIVFPHAAIENRSYLEHGTKVAPDALGATVMTSLFPSASSTSILWLAADRGNLLNGRPFSVTV
jgi:hypothetical protein